jgi:hypothetical protein
VGKEVETHMVIKPAQEHAGSIVVKMREDISFWTDGDYNVKTLPLNLKGDQVT